MPRLGGMWSLLLLGSRRGPRGTTFRGWAPNATAVSVSLRSSLHTLPMTSVTRGYWQLEVPGSLRKRYFAPSSRAPRRSRCACRPTLHRTRRAAQSRGVPYQSLIKVLVDQGVRRLERPHSTGRRSASSARSRAAPSASKPSVDSQFDSQSARTTSDEGARTRTKGGRAQIRSGRQRTSPDTRPST